MEGPGRFSRRKIFGLAVLREQPGRCDANPEADAGIASFPSNAAYTTGNNKSVSAVELTRPPMTTIASGR